MFENTKINEKETGVGPFIKSMLTTRQSVENSSYLLPAPRFQMYKTLAVDLSSFLSRSVMKYFRNPEGLTR